MAMSTRTKTVLSVLTVVAVLGGGVVGYLMFTGNTGAIPFLGGARDPAECPLTGVEADREGATGRTAVAVKVENIEEARPQAGLREADVVYEEPVEGGITRFIAIFQCEDADRVGPVRSARLVDPSILTQYGPAIFAYSGGIQRVKSLVERSPLQDLSQDSAPDLYTLDPNRSAPHHVYSDTKTLRRGAEQRNEPPEPVFEFDEAEPERQGSKRGRDVHLPFSSFADVNWDYRGGQDVYVRSHGDVPHTTEDGEQISAANVVVLEVELVDSGVVDAAGNPSPEVVAEGSGKAYIFRNGRLIQGEWRRPGEEDVMEFVDKSGDVIPLAPGTTWIELFPNDLPVEVG